jgi:hypothetical protein
MRAMLRRWRSKLFTNEKEMAEMRRLESLRFSTEEDRFLFAEAKLGIEVDDFWHSDVGKYLRMRSEQVMDGAVKALLSAAPSDQAAIAKAQVDARAMLTLNRFITDAIRNGETSELALFNNEETNDGNSD